MTLATPLPPEITARTKSGTRAATQVLRALAAHGVRAAFGIPGGAAGPIFDALSDVPEIELVSTRHETTAVFAAIGHARATGIPALVIVTAGPGVTNTLTGVASAHLEEVPLIVLGGEVATSWAGRGAFQDGSQAGLDVVTLMRNVTRWSASVYAPSMAAGAAARAWSIATGSRPGPVFLSIPYDVGQASSLGGTIVSSLDPVPVPPAAACKAAAEFLGAARRPLLVLGSGARHAVRAGVELAERLSSPVVATPHAKGVFPERHPLYLGLIGNVGHPSARDYIASGPDVVCVVGSRLGDFATNAWRTPIAGRSATIQIDRDPFLIGRNAPVTLGIVGDASATLLAIAAHLPEERCSGSSIRERVALRTKPWNENAPAGLVKPQRAVIGLGEAFPDAIFCSDIGEHMGFAQHYLSVDGPDRFHCMSGLGSMGSGFGAAIGIKHANPGTTVVVFVGDGGFNMHVGEMLTCVEHRIGVVFVVFNDGRWSMVEHGFRAVFRRAPGGLPKQVANLAAVARAYGADGHVIDSAAALAPERLRSLVRGPTPLVLDVRIDPSESLSDSTRSSALALIGKGST
jgi:acetolactate synthase-1/2/3 large subunit